LISSQAWGENHVVVTASSLSRREPTQIGFVGAGNIGLAMALQLHSAGNDVLVLVRNAERAEEMSEWCLKSSTDPNDLLDRSVLISCLYDDAQLLEVFIGHSGIAHRVSPGTLLISHTTGNPEALAAVDRILRVRGGSAVEATFSGDAGSVVEGTLTVLLSGEEADIARAEDILGAYAGTLIRCGELGHAQRAKLLNNLLFAANAQLALSAMQVGAALGLEQAVIVEAIQASSGGSRAMGLIAQFPEPDSFIRQAGRYMRKDVACCVKVAAELGVPIELLRSVAESSPALVGASPLQIPEG
jgi:3-hydroxyisobutyrate dehydrogenase-like beta-hydroxyacid dehydrogenase